MCILLYTVQAIYISATP